jgi:thiol-disulfide isomerase/thioredoxin
MTNTKKILIGKVYANWCGHCVSLKPEWQKMKSHIKKYFKHIHFIEAESSQTSKIKDITRKHNLNVQGYPTLFKIQENGEIEYYKGPRLAKDLVYWATGNAKINKKRNYSRKYMGGKNKRRRSTQHKIDC